MTPLAIDKTTELDISGSRQKVRVRAARTGLPPLLVVQGGPGLPILHEVEKFRRLLNLEKDFLVCYWEQRGCGNASVRDAESGSMPRHVDDLRAVIRWFRREAGQPLIVLGISLGGTLTLRAVEHESSRVRAVVVISPDSHTTSSDTYAAEFLHEQGRLARSGRLSRRVTKLEPPPYVDAAPFQRRASLLIDLGAVEYGKRFAPLLRETFVGMIRAYGPLGTMRALRNMNRVQRTVLPELVSLDLLANPPRVTIPVHYVFGERDALTPPSLVDKIPSRIGAPGSTVVYIPNAGHHVHFDHPDVVRSIIAKA
jgi:pimeloyl-ACP methyl ester carboxylesterase